MDQPYRRKYISRDFSEQDRASAAFAQKALGKMAHQNILLVVDRRELVRGCLTSWLSVSCSEFETVAIADVASFTEDARLVHAAAALVSAALVSRDGSRYLDEWSAEQVESLRANRPDLPIVMIVELEDTSTVDSLAERLGVQGYIPTSSSVKVAAAALRLIVAGGRYFPAVQNQRHPAALLSIDHTRRVVDRDSVTKLTPRENAVLNVLAVGAQNKIIAYQLGMSLSTVKAHVHSIIRKLHVRNRTEVVVVARTMQATATHPDQILLFASSAIPQVQVAG
jgi:DNA-binding NarL/FixJ family response regulator